MHHKKEFWYDYVLGSELLGTTVSLSLVTPGAKEQLLSISAVAPLIISNNS